MDRKENYIDRILSPEAQLFNGLILLVFNIFFSDLVKHLILFAVLIILNLIKKKRIPVLFFFIILGSITFFNLLTPQGKLLFYLFSFPVTLDSLLGGVEKGVFLFSFMLIAHFAISPQLKLPGRVGQLISRILHYFQYMRDSLSFKRGRNILKEIDQLLVHLWVEGDPWIAANQNPSQIGALSKKNTRSGIIFTIINISIIILLISLI